jgi:hypothetical protein
VTADPVDRIFARSEPHVRETARALIARTGALADVVVDPKGTCLHLNRRTAFAGLHPRKAALLLNLRSSAPIVSGRVRKVERASANRYHNELLLESADAIDEQLMEWVAEAHALAG